MTDMNMLFKVINILLPLVSLVMISMAMKNLYEYAGRVPGMWKRMFVGIGFIFVSELLSFFKIYFGQAAYHIDFFVQVFLITGLTYFFIGLMPYIRDISGD